MWATYNCTIVAQVKTSSNLLLGIFFLVNDYLPLYWAGDQSFLTPWQASLLGFEPYLYGGGWFLGANHSSPHAQNLLEYSHVIHT